MLYYKFSFLFTLKPTILILLLQDVRFFLDPSFTLLHPPSSFSAPLPSVRITFYALVLELLLPIVKVLLEKFSMEPFAFKPEFPRGEFAFKTITLLLRAFSGVEALSMERLTF